MNRAARGGTTFWKIGMLLLLSSVLAACGGNSTTIGIVVSAPGVASGSTATIITNGTLQFTATVTGISTTTVYWRICLPAASVTIQPTNCTAIPGVTTASATSLSGYGSISQTGLYTAPPTLPAPDSFVIMAISTVSTHILDTTGTVNSDFGVLAAKIDTGVRVQVFPTTATIGTGETLQLTATVTGTTNQGVSWSVNGIAGGNSSVGFICPNPAITQACSSGEYFAPTTVPTAGVTITAASSADSSQTGTATVTVSNVADATLASIDPIVTLQGAAQQNVYLTGSNFFTTDTVYVAPPSQAAAAVPTTFISTTLIRATIPSNLLTQAGQDQISVLRQNGSPNSPGPVALTVNPTRPAIVAVTPDSVSQSSTGGTVSIALTGGFFASPATTALFNGASIAPSITSSRQLSITTPVGAIATPGLYPLFVQNSGVPVTQSSMSAVNIAVTPSPLNIPSAPVGSVAVGASPDAIAIDYALGIAAVANNAGNSVSFINNLGASPAVFASVGVGHGPTGIAIDDSLHIALVVNSTDQTLSTINLNLPAPVVTSTISVAIGPTAGSASGPAPIPYSVGINSLTHHAIVAYESFNEATVLNVSSGTPSVLEQIGGDVTAPIGTGTTPAVAVDERLNWAVVTPGGGGAQTTTIVDLGSNATGVIGARSPQVIASLALSTQGVGINSETHQALFTSPSAGNLATFSLLDNSVTSINFTNNGIAFDQLGLTAAAADPLEDIGIAVNSVSGTAVIADLENGNVLLTVAGLSSPQAIAVDPATNRAFVANQGNNTVSVLSLGTAIDPIQIVEASPAITSTSSSNLTLTVNGNFPASSVVRLDQVPLPSSACVAGTRQIMCNVPASMLGVARNYAVDVLSTGTGVSNVTYLTVVQPVVVGNSPVGVAVDTDRDLAIVTNSGSGTVSLVALSPTTPVGISQQAAGAVGTIGAPLTVGTTPLGVAVLPRLGLALVANNGSNNASLVDVTQTFVPQTIALCASGGACTGPTAVAINPDTAASIVTNAGILNDTAAPSSLSFATITPAPSNGVPGLSSVTLLQNVDQNPVSVAIDPSPSALNPGLSYAAVGTASTASSVEVFNLSTQVPQRISNFENPTGLIFDPLNQQFIVANSLSNNLVIVDPNTLIETPVQVGIDPTALDYDYQTSTLVTSNLASRTLSILDYVCPPASGGASCLNPQVRAVLPLGGSQQFSVAVDPNLNLAVVVDQANNQVLLVPLLH